MRKRLILAFILCFSMVLGTGVLSAVAAISEWKIPLPGGDWKAEYSPFFESWELYKDNYYDGLDSTMSIFVNNMTAEESLLASENLTSSMLDAEIREVDYEVNSIICPAYEQYSEKHDETMVKVFYPLSSQESLQIKISVKKGNRQGFDPDSDEAKQIIQGIIEENGLGSSALSGEESADSSDEAIEITADGLSIEGEPYMDDAFSFIVPDEWQVFSSKYGGVYLIKDGTSKDDYGAKPSIVLNYNEEDAYTSCITSKKYYGDATDLRVTICGTDCFAISYKEEMASKSVYWIHTKIFMPVSGSANVSIDIITDSSEFEGVDILDDDVRQVIVSLQGSF